MTDWRDQFLYPQPNGTIICAVAPYTKKCYFERHMDVGVEYLDGPPEGVKIPKGYTLGIRRSSASGV